MARELLGSTGEAQVQEVPMRLAHAAMTEKGRARESNEDVYVEAPDDRLFLVADGMGGHAMGDVASRLAAHTIRDFLRDTSVPGDRIADTAFEKLIERRLVEGIKAANDRIRERSAAWRVGAMGTTVVAAVCYDDETLIAHVGDSRCYRIREGEIRQLTEDHTLRNALLRAMGYEPGDGAGPALPTRNVLTRALGAEADVQVDVCHDHPEPGDVYLLCSDGLFEALPDKRIREIVEDHREDLDGACRALVEAAMDEGEPDDVTALLIAY
jgi:protein phosphatase